MRVEYRDARLFHQVAVARNACAKRHFKGEKMELIAYWQGVRYDMVIAASDVRREWCDATTQAFAYRCLPMRIANEAGWFVLNDATVRARWNGGDGPDALEVEHSVPKPWSAISHFGHGILTFSIPFLFRTPPETQLLMRGPANWPKDGVAPLEGVIETDWAVASATMNWKFTRPNVWVEFKRREPICMIVPFKISELERMEPRYGEMSEDPSVEREFKIWFESRGKFLKDLKENDPGAVKQGWQRHYFKGITPAESVDGASMHAEHRMRLHLSEF